MASLQLKKTCGVSAKSLAVRPCRTARAISWILSLAFGATIVPPAITPFLSHTSLTKPSRKSLVFERPMIDSGAMALLILRSRLIQSSSVRPTDDTSGKVKVVRGVAV